MIYVKRKSLGGFLVNRNLHLQLSEYAKLLWERMVKAKPSIPMAHIEICEAYQGFDKEAWPGLNLQKTNLEEGLASLEQFNNVIEYYKNLSGSSLIYLNFSKLSSQIPKLVQDKFNFLGYDYGYFLSEDNYFSVILNEIIFGNYKEMTAYAKFLNKNLLFSDLKITDDLSETRSNLLREGADLEGEEEFVPIGIHKYIASLSN